MDVAPHGALPPPLNLTARGAVMRAMPPCHARCKTVAIPARQRNAVALAIAAAPLRHISRRQMPCASALAVFSPAHCCAGATEKRRGSAQCACYMRTVATAKTRGRLAVTAHGYGPMASGPTCYGDARRASWHWRAVLEAHHHRMRAARRTQRHRHRHRPTADMGTVATPTRSRLRCCAARWAGLGWAGLGSARLGSAQRHQPDA
ncbi:hypothetical protein FHY35_000254 [Xanthomonas arboricola]|nr:hypothetical protein [Xanthomonas arboricola]